MDPCGRFVIVIGVVGLEGGWEWDRGKNTVWPLIQVGEQKDDANLVRWSRKVVRNRFYIELIVIRYVRGKQGTVVIYERTPSNITRKVM